ncbi:MAG: flagellar filament capping protein FliD [Methylococcales bacterium]
MPGISSLGIGSGLDLSGLVQKLVAAEAQSTSARFDRREANFQSELSALGLFKSALSDFKSAQQELLSIGDFQTISAESGDSSLYTVKADTDARIGQHSIEIQSLARSQKLASKAFSSNTDIVGSGTLTFRFGSYDSGSNTFSANSQKAIQTVNIDPANNTLAGIRDAVNNAEIGVRASIVDDGTGHRLVFSSVDTGVENSFEITVGSDLDGNDQDDAGLSQLAYDPVAAGSGSGKNLTETVAAKDAQLVVDGLTITRSENTIEGVIEGITLELKSAAPGNTTDLTITNESGTVTNKVKQFVDNFNTLISSLGNLNHYNAETGQAGPLFGDSSARGVESKVRNILTNAVTGLTGGVVALADIGITTQKDGTLKLDSSKLQAAVDANPDAVARLFSESGQVPDSLLRFSGSENNSIPGKYAINVTQLATQGAYSGTAVSGFPLTVDSTNDTLGIKVDGVDSATIQLGQGSYNTGDELATELQRKINSDSALVAAGVRVSVTIQSGRFQISSDRYGSASSVEITSVGTASAATLGLSAAAGTAGADVVGTIGGLPASGSGQTLTGTGSASGLSIEVSGGALGDRGDLSFARGVSAKLVNLIDGILESDSVIDSRTNNLNDRIKDLGDQRVEQSRRLSSYQARLVSQFTALDTLISQLQTTNTFLTQQLSNLPGFGRRGS